MRTIAINTFPGMVADPRNTRGSQLCKHFDNFTTKSLVPYRDSEDAFVSQSTIQLQSFLMYLGNMYALGRQSATAKALINKNSNVGVPSWSSPTNGQDNTYTISDYTFYIEYKGILWGTNSQGLWSYNIGTTSFTENAQAISGITNITQGLVHSKDDTLYVGYTNATASYIASKNGAGGWSITALTLPASIILTSICEYGNYLAISYRSANVGGKSGVFLWDRDSSLATISESIDWGGLDLYQIENIDGYIIGISLTGNTSATLRPRLVFSRYSGGSTPHVFSEIPLTSGVNTIIGKQKANDRFYFGLNASSYGYTTQYDYTGIWSIGRKSESEEFSVNFIQLANNDNSVQAIKGFILVQDYFYISYLDSNGAFGLSKTNDQLSLTATSVYHTAINPGDMPDEDKLKLKKLMSAGLTYEPIISPRQCILKYKVENISFTTVYTETTVTTQATEMTDANGTPFSDGRDIEFQIESKGVTVTGLFYKYDPILTKI